MCTGAVTHLGESGRELFLSISGSHSVDQVYQMSCSSGSILPPTTSEYNVGQSVAFQAFKTWVGDMAGPLMLFSVCLGADHSPPHIPTGNVLIFPHKLI